MLNYYKVQIVIALVRFVFWFVLLIRVITPLLFKEIKDLPKNDKLIYSWLGLGGVILLSIILLTILHIYDLFSICFTIILIPIIRSIWTNRDIGVFAYLEQVENKIVISQVRFIEDFKGIRTFFVRLLPRDKVLNISFNWKAWLLAVAIFAAFVIRFYPTLIYAEPFSRQWFFYLDSIKHIRLQDYFNNSGSPAGIYAFITLFSMLTQVSPELILHFFGALNSVLLMYIIFWSVKKIVGEDKFWVALSSMIFFGLIPTILLPVAVNNQIEADKLYFAFCFAIPTILLFIKDRQDVSKKPMFFVMAGMIATGLTNIFVLLVVVIPIIIITFLVQVGKFKASKNLSDLYRLIISLSISLSPTLLFVIYKKLNLWDYFKGQLFSINVFSRLNTLVFPIDILSQYYLIIASVLFLIYLVLYVIRKNTFFLNITIFLMLFITISFAYTNHKDIGYTYIDWDQLNPFYALLITGLFGISFYTVTLPLYSLNPTFKTKIFRNILSGIIIIGIISGINYYNKGFKLYKPESQTLPGSFFKAYYKIINNHVPHTYTVVAPDIFSTLALNRHNAMDYEYFLDHYSKKDSIFYVNYDIKNSKEQKKRKQNLPNIFLFVENKPYDKIQAGILPNKENIMTNMNRWLYKNGKLKQRNIKIYYKSPEVNVYEIINSPDNSSILNVLFHGIR